MLSWPGCKELSPHTMKYDPFILTENVTGTFNMEDQEMKG